MQIRWAHPGYTLQTAQVPLLFLLHPSILGSIAHAPSATHKGTHWSRNHLSVLRETEKVNHSVYHGLVCNSLYVSQSNMRTFKNISQ